MLSQGKRAREEGMLPVAPPLDAGALLGLTSARGRVIGDCFAAPAAGLGSFDACSVRAQLPLSALHVAQGVRYFEIEVLENVSGLVMQGGGWAPRGSGP